MLNKMSAESFTESLIDHATTDCRPHLGSTSIEFLPSFKRACHLYTVTGLHFLYFPVELIIFNCFCGRLFQRNTQFHNASQFNVTYRRHVVIPRPSFRPSFLPSVRLSVTCVFSVTRIVLGVIALDFLKNAHSQPFLSH